MAHINIYAEDFSNVEFSVVEKKGYFGVKVVTLNKDGIPQGAFTLWGFDRERLVADLELMLSVAKGATPKELKPSGTLGE